MNCFSILGTNLKKKPSSYLKDYESFKLVEEDSISNSKAKEEDMNNKAAKQTALNTVDREGTFCKEVNDKLQLECVTPTNEVDTQPGKLFYF